MIRYSGVHQFHSGTALGDAITNQMFYLQKQLQEMGFASEIFAEHIAPGLQDRIHSIHGYHGSESELLLLHHSVGYEAFDDVIRSARTTSLRCTTTSLRSGTSRDERVRHYIRLGRDQLALLARRALFGIAVSNFNRREMLAAGFRRVEVLPVRVDFSQFTPLDRDVGDGHRATGCTSVGIIGNKCQHELVTGLRPLPPDVRHRGPPGPDRRHLGR